jgi:RNA polymerase sigma factor (TIGR02999 family)
MRDPRGEVTRLLQSGERDALLALVYGELRAIAAARMALERREHTLQATALVHEAYLRLVDQDGTTWERRAHFFATASEAMRRILVDHARKGGTAKRGGGARRVTLGAADAPVELDFEQAAVLDDALEVLEREDERAAAVTRLRFLAGLSVEETAQALSISVRSVRREWTFARARLFELLGLGHDQRGRPA